MYRTEHLSAFSYIYSRQTAKIWNTPSLHRLSANGVDDAMLQRHYVEYLLNLIQGVSVCINYFVVVSLIPARL